MDVDETNRIIRAMVQHEDGLREQRLGWLLTLNGFLFAALSFAWEEDGIEALGWVAAALGIASALSAVATMVVSRQAIKFLETEFKRLAGAQEATELPPVRGMTSRWLCKKGGIYKVLPLFYIWNLIPWALVLVWFSALGVLIYHKVM